MEYKVIVKTRYDFNTSWEIENPVLEKGELAVVMNESDPEDIKMKVGDGETNYVDLPFISLSYTKLIIEMDQITEEMLSHMMINYYLKDDAQTLSDSVDTRFTQVNTNIENKYNELSADLQTLQGNTNTQFQNLNEYIRVENGVVILGKDENPMKFKVEGNKVLVSDNSGDIAYWQDGKLYAIRGHFTNTLRVGDFAFQVQTDGGVSFNKIT